VDAIEANPRQPREAFDEEAMAELVSSIESVGLLQPVVVRAMGADRYQLVMGERRWRAVRQAGLTTIPAIVRDTDDDAMLRDALLENLHRQELNPLEEAAAYGQLLEDFGVTHEELARRLGRSRAQVSNTLRLLQLTPPVQRRVAAGVLSAGHARALLGFSDSAGAEELAERIVAEGLSVRAVEEIVAVGDGGSRKRRSAPARSPDPDLNRLAEELGERLETRVRIQGERRRGRIVIDFGSPEDLRRLTALMGSPEASPTDASPADRDTDTGLDTEAEVTAHEKEEAPPESEALAAPDSSVGFDGVLSGVERAAGSNQE
jgi:ParB family chromosome partitioning protein